MKKIYFLTVIIFIANQINAQWSTSGSNVYYNSGNVGVGTATPGAKLDVLGNSLFLTGTNRIYFSEVYAFDPTQAGFRNNAGNIVMNAKEGGVLYLNRDINAETHIQSNSVDIIVVKSNGTVGIGTNAPGTNKLAVEGTIGARAVKVTLTNPWPDYVFTDNYKLTSLPELEQYIKANSHLPNIPSANEVTKNGIDLGTMDTELLKKVEELTLYVIELKKENEKIKEELKKLNKE